MNTQKETKPEITADPQGRLEALVMRAHASLVTAERALRDYYIEGGGPRADQALKDADYLYGLLARWERA